MEPMDDWDEENEETVYSESGRESMVEDGELSAEEDAFMQGYNQADEELE